MSRFLDHIEKRVNKIGVLEVSSFELINGVVLTKKKDEVILDTEIESIPIFNLKKEIPTSIPLILVIQNDKVITKVRGSGDKLSFEEEDHFLIQKNNISNGQTIVSAIKEEEVISLQKLFKNHIILDYAVGLGDLILLIEREILHEKEIYTPSKKLVFSENLAFIEDSNALSEKYKIGDDIISSNLLLPYTVGLSFFLNNPNKVVSETDFQKKGMENFGYFYGYSILLLPLTLIFIFCFVLTFFILDNYQNQKNNQASEIEFLKIKQFQLQELEEEYKTKLNLMNQFGIKVNQGYYSSQLDWIGFTLIPNIVLTEIQYHPINENNINNNKNTEIELNKIIIKGNSEEVVDLNKWIEQLAKKENIMKITILYFDEQRDQSNFSIELKTKM